MKKLIALSLSLMTIAGFCSCSTKSSLSAAPAEISQVTQTMYKMEKLSWPEDFSGLTDIAYIDGVGTRMIYSSTDSIFRIAIYDEDFQCISNSELEGDFSENSNLRCFVSPDGVTHILNHSVEFDESLKPDETEQEQSAWEKYYATGTVTMTVSYYGKDGRLIDSFTVADDRCFSYADQHFISGFAPCGENYLITTDEAMVLVDGSGEIIDIGKYDMGDTYICDSQGQLLYCDFNGYAVADTDAPFNLPGELTPYLDNKTMNGADTGSLGYTMYFYLTDGFYGMTADGEMTKLIDYLKSNISGSEVRTITPVGEGKFLLYNAGNKGQYLCALTIRPDDYVPSQKKVIAGSYEGGYTIDIADAAAEYNRYSDNYAVEVKNYNDTDSIRNDILSGESPDFLIYTDYDIMPKFVNLGAFADMNELYAEYGGISPDEMMPNVVEALTYKGGLYSMCTAFTLDPLFADKEVIGSEHSYWNVDEFLDIAENMPDDMYLGSQWIFRRRDDVYYFLVQNNLSNWIDYERGTCNFDSDEFIRVLNFIKNVNIIEDKDFGRMTEEEMAMDAEEDAHRIKKHEAMLFGSPICDINSFYQNCALYGYSPEDVTWLTVPNKDAAGNIQAGNSILFSVVQGGDCTEGGWDFASYLMSYDYQSGLFPTFAANKKVFDEKCRKEQKQLNEGGKTSSVHNGYSVEYSCNISDEELEKLKGFILKHTSFSGNDHVISDMIKEEFDSFINGETSAEECAEMLQNRISLYLAENA